MFGLGPYKRFNYTPKNYTRVDRGATAGLKLIQLILHFVVS